MATSENLSLSILEKFSWPSKTGTIEQDALIIVTSNQPEFIISIVDKDGWTLLHHACYKGWFKVVKYLIEHKANPHHLNNYKSTPLHWAAFGGHIEIVKYLVNELGCDPNCENKRGNTPLQIACWKGKLKVIEFLVTDCKCDPLKPNNNGLTPLYEAFICNHIHIVSFLLSTGVADGIITQISIPDFVSEWYSKIYYNIIEYRRKNPLKPTLKVFILGDIGVGKTTLTSALQKKFCGSRLGSVGGKYRTLPEVPPQTAGVNPVLINSNESRQMMLFDFAGHQEFYSSHAALLEHLESSQGAVIIIVLDLSTSEDKIKRSLECWKSFLDSIYCNNKRPQIIIIGSHSDVVKRRGENAMERLQCICQAVNLWQWDANSVLIAINCTRVSSTGLSVLCDKLIELVGKYHMMFNVGTQAHVISAIVREHFKGRVACQVHELTAVLESQNKGLYEYDLLPSDVETLSRLIDQLSELGELVYLKSEDIGNGWIVFDKHLLFSEVNGTIFAPKKFKAYYNISNSTGIVLKRKMESIFKNHNIDMITEFLVYFKYCYKVPTIASTPESTERYFFPQLVRESKAEVDYFEDCAYTCKWESRCKKNYQCFTSRFAHSILVHLATSFSLTPEDVEESSCPVELKECNTWNTGIHWKDMDGCEIIVEFDNSFKTVYLEMGCQGGVELSLVKLRSRIISLILKVKELFSKDIETLEAFLYPANLAVDVAHECSKERIYLAIKKEKKFVVSKRDNVIKQIPFNDMLFVEPLALIPKHILMKIFSAAVSAEMTVDSELLHELSTLSQSDATNFIQSMISKPRLKFSDLRSFINSHSVFSDQWSLDVSH